jgi:hypothetical protein
MFKLSKGAEYFGADCAVLAKTNEVRYDKAQSLMKKVLKMAHELGSTALWRWKVFRG